MQKILSASRRLGSGALALALALACTLLPGLSAWAQTTPPPTMFDYAEFGNTAKSEMTTGISSVFPIFLGIVVGCVILAVIIGFVRRKPRVA